MEKLLYGASDFRKNPIVLKQMTPEDKYFYLYLLTIRIRIKLESIKLRKNKWLLI